MLSLLLLLPIAAPPSQPTAVAPLAVPAQDLKDEYEKRRAEAEGDLAKLWDVANWCEANSLDKEMRSCLRAILKLDDNDKKAHELLGHVYYDGQWFTSDKKLEAYKKKEEERIAKEEGLVRYKDGWAHPDDIPFLEKGLVKTDDGKWVDPEMQKRLEEGWRQQDLVWVSPDEFEKMDAGLFKCGDDWLSLEDANAYHSEINQWWAIPGEYYHLYTTLPRESAMQALNEVEATFRDLTKIYGVTPTEPLRVMLLRSADQYRGFAGGIEGKWPGTDATGFSSLHGAFFADGLINYDLRKWNGAGAGYWDFTNEDGVRFGRTFARHAAGQSFGEFVDPSPKAIAKFQESTQSQFPTEDFYAEKKIPLWFRYGAAAYVERYYIDPYVAAGGDKEWARKWSVSNIARGGGLDPLSSIFAMELTPDNVEASAKLINESGLLVSFVVDGKCPPVIEAHGAVKAALKKGEDPSKAFKNLEKVIEKNLDKLKQFADL